MLAIIVCGCGPPAPEQSNAIQHFLAGQEARSKGDLSTALSELNLSIQDRPDVWTYFERAQVHREMGNDAEALADCAAGLQLDGQHKQLTWLRGELRKPKGERFQGRSAAPPAGK
jgi:hypothetical protein